MKAVIDHKNSGSDFYLSNLAPLNRRSDSRFSAADLAMLIVLFLEVAVLVRLVLAN